MIPLKTGRWGLLSVEGWGCAWQGACGCGWAICSRGQSNSHASCQVHSNKHLHTHPVLPCAAQADSKGEDSMDFPNFFDALFELADMWWVCALFLSTRIKSYGAVGAAWPARLAAPLIPLFIRHGCARPQVAQAHTQVSMCFHAPATGVRRWTQRTTPSCCLTCLKIPRCWSSSTASSPSGSYCLA